MVEEFQALLAIFPDTFEVVDAQNALATQSFQCARGVVTLVVSKGHGGLTDWDFDVISHFPIPTAGPGAFEEMPASKRSDIRNGLAAIQTQAAGEPCLFECVQFVQDFVENEYGQACLDEDTTDVSSKGATAEWDIVSKAADVSVMLPSEATAVSDSNAFLTCSEPITERKSVFIGHCARVSDASQVQEMLDGLGRDRRIAKATHNIWAYRIVTASVTIQDFDDDGETGAGSRLLHLLQLLKLSNVLVVVSRYFGGVKLGPARFKLINNAARQEPQSPTTPFDTTTPVKYVAEEHRSQSMNGFQHASFSAAANNMRNHLMLLKANHPDEGRENFVLEMDDYYSLFTRYLAEKAESKPLDWSKIKSPGGDQLISYADISQSPPNSSDLLGKLAVLKLNGGLGTTMGCVGPKSAIEVRDGMTFLDLIVRQIEYLSSESKVHIPLILMNSFNTDIETARLIQKYQGHDVQILTFNQSRFPRIFKDSMQPIPKSYDSPIAEWYPPGHGDMYEALSNSGMLDKLLDMGKEYIFVSNVDNLGATVDPSILAHMVESGAEFIMEVTDKTKADIKGGTIIDYEGGVRLLEIAQVPPEFVAEFKSVKKFKIFNTNNLWISLRAIKRILAEDTLKMEIISNVKTHESGEKILQLETAVGAAIKHFRGSHGVNVPRRRFLPVKSTSDLFHIISDLYSIHHGKLIMSPKRVFPTIPVVKLGDHFKKVQHFLSRFASPPKILELDHLTVTGDVTFGSNVVLIGTVIIVANHGERIDIPSGAILNDKVVSGNLRILDH